MQSTLLIQMQSNQMSFALSIATFQLVKHKKNIKHAKNIEKIRKNNS